MDYDTSYRLHGVGTVLMLWGIALLLVGLGVGEAGHQSVGGSIIVVGLCLIGLDLLLITYLLLFD